MRKCLQTFVSEALIFPCYSRRAHVHVIARKTLLSHYSSMEGAFISIFRAPNGFLSSWVCYRVFPGHGNAPFLPAS